MAGELEAWQLRVRHRDSKVRLVLRIEAEPTPDAPDPILPLWVGVLTGHLLNCGWEGVEVSLVAEGSEP